MLTKTGFSQIGRPINGPWIEWPLNTLGGERWTPAKLFASGEDGAWFDPSDFTSMFLGRTGTDLIEGNPGVGDVVGFIADKSKLGGKTLRNYINDPANNLCTNPDFTDGTTGWAAASADISAVDGELRVAWNGTGNFPTGRFSFTPEAGATYYVSATARRIDTGSAAPSLVLKQPANVTAISGTTSTTGETIHVIYKSPSTTNINVDLFVYNGADAGDVAYFDDVKIVKIPGNHLVAPSDAARPVLYDDISAGVSTTSLSGAELYDEDVVIAGSGDTNEDYTDGVITVIRNGSGNGIVPVTGNLEDGAWYKITATVAPDGGEATHVVDFRQGLNSLAANRGYDQSSAATITVEKEWSCIFVANGTVGINMIGGPANGYSWSARNISIQKISDAAARRYYLEGDGVDDYLEVDFVTSNDMTISHAFRTIDTATNTDVFEIAAASRPDMTNVWRMDDTGTGGLTLQVTAAAYATQASATNPNVGGVTHIYTEKLKTDDFEFWRDGASQATDTLGTWPDTASASFHVFSNTTGSSPAAVRWYGGLLIDRVVSDDERGKLEKFLAQKSGATLA